MSTIIRQEENGDIHIHIAAPTYAAARARWAAIGIALEALDPGTDPSPEPAAEPPSATELQKELLATLTQLFNGQYQQVTPWLVARWSKHNTPAAVRTKPDTLTAEELTLLIQQVVSNPEYTKTQWQEYQATKTTPKATK